MLYSEQYNFLYVHVSKTGGSNMERALRPFSDQPALNPLDRLLNTFHWHWNYKRYRFRQHDSAATAARVLPREVFDRCFKFAMVRNPWDWLTSLYFFLKRKDSHRHSKRVNRMSFAEYVDFEIARDKRHQHRFMLDGNGKMLLDHVGRFEELQNAFDYCTERLGMPQLELERISVFKRTNYQEMYDDALIDKVRRHWKTDIEAFGYTYDSFEPGDVAENYRRRS